jgi:hypothetical protein
LVSVVSSTVIEVYSNATETWTKDTDKTINSGLVGVTRAWINFNGTVLMVEHESGDAHTFYEWDTDDTAWVASLRNNYFHSTLSVHVDNVSDSRVWCDERNVYYMHNYRPNGKLVRMAGTKQYQANTTSAPLVTSLVDKASTPASIVVAVGPQEVLQADSYMEVFNKHL